MFDRNADFGLRRSLKASCLLHFCLFSVVGLAFQRDVAPPSAKESYVFVELQDTETAHAMETPTGLSARQGAVRVTGGAATPAHRGAADAKPSRSPANGSVVVPATAAGVMPQGNSTGISAGSLQGADDGVGSNAGDDGAQFYETDGGEGDGNGGGVGIDMAAIAAAFAERVESRKEYPYMAVKRGQTGKVEVWVSLAADGSLADVQVTSASGVAILDKSAVQAVRAACPFAHDAGRAVQFVIPIYFTLAGG